MRRKKDYLVDEVLDHLQSFEETAMGLFKISEPIGERHSMPSGKETEYIYTAVTEDICRKCPKYRDCFGDRRGRTLGEISRIFKKAEQEMKVEGWMASDDFRKNCIYYQPFIEELSWLFRMLYQNYRWEMQMEEMGASLRGQLYAQYLLIKECRRILSEGEMITGSEKRKIFLAMLRCGIYFLDGRKLVDGEGFLSIHVTVQPIFGHARPADVADVLSRIYQKCLRGSLMERRLHAGTNHLSLVEEGCFQVLFGSSRCSRHGESICGDTFSFSSVQNRHAVMILSDGMGVGEQAFVDSKKLMDVFESMMEAGIYEEYALQILHRTLLMQSKQKFSTLDATILSMCTGMVKILKAGGAATFVRHGKSVERISVESMPPGCMDGQQFAICYKKLYDGDMIIMVSDGMLDFENLPEISLRMEDYMESITTQNAQTFARQLMEMVPVPENGHDDDRTVLVASVWERRK